MALVPDQSDMGGQGMFSKAGRYTTEKYMIFSKKDEILYDKRKTISIKDLNQKQKNEQKVEDDDNDYQIEEIQVQEQPQKNVEKKERKKLKQPMGRHQSREECIESRRHRYYAPPVGYYCPKYKQIDKNMLFTQNLKEYSKNRFKMRKGYYDPRCSLQEEIDRPGIVQRVKDRIIGPLTLGDQQPRKEMFINRKNNPHEKRFIVSHFNDKWSNIPKLKGFSMKSLKGREDNIIYKKSDFAPDYDPNFEVTKKVIAVSVRNMSQDLNRKPMHRMSLTQNENFFNYDFYCKVNNQKSQLFERLKTPEIGKQLTRNYEGTKGVNSNPNNKVMPSFMQRNVNSRLSITQLSSKMIEQNCYETGRFQSINSAFERTKSQQNLRYKRDISIEQ